MIYICVIAIRLVLLLFSLFFMLLMFFFSLKVLLLLPIRASWNMHFIVCASWPSDVFLLFACCCCCCPWCVRTFLHLHSCFFTTSLYTSEKAFIQFYVLSFSAVAVVFRRSSLLHSFVHFQLAHLNIIFHWIFTHIDTNKLYYFEHVSLIQPQL